MKNVTPQITTNNALTTAHQEIPKAVPSPTHDLANPRFVWLIGAWAEAWPDIPATADHSGDIVLWDRQEGRAAVMVAPDYQQAICLETTGTPADAPFTNVADWLNGLSNICWKSEGMKPTRKEFRK